jgi:O-antigen/teichoic acid export membrane protein
MEPLAGYSRAQEASVNDAQVPLGYLGTLKARVLKSRLLTASMWVLAIGVLGQVMRFGSNLVLTRLLAPEAFGLVAIVSAVRAGTEMISDIGVSQAVVSSDRIDNPEFLRTAWTFKAVRGLALAGILLALAYPVSLWFEQPTLFGLVAVAGISAAAKGANHICEFTLVRKMRQRALALTTFFTALLGIVAMIGLAWWWRSVWALVIGGLCGDIAFLIVTHVLGRATPMFPRWDAESMSALRKFGRWVFISSILTYLINQGDRLVLGSLMTMEQLGQYAVAANVAAVVPAFLAPLYQQVLFPLFAEEGRTTTPALRKRVLRARLALLAISVPVLALLVGFGDLLIQALWDPRYRAAGFILPILALGQLLFTIGKIGPIHLVRGETWISFVTESSRALGLALGVALGYAWFGSSGVVLGVGLSLAVGYPLSVWLSRRYGVWFPWVDLGALAASAAIIVACTLLKQTLGW